MTVIKHCLGFSLRTDATTELGEIRPLVEKALGCALESAWNYGMFLLQGELLGMRILLGEWRGINRVRTFQLHGMTELPIERDETTYPEPSVVTINEAIIDLLRRHGLGEWRAPSFEESLAESAYADEVEKERQGETGE